jgi:hypothetical protein
MTQEQFVYWLQGYMEIAKPLMLNMRETRIIKDHLALVFDKKTPEREEEKEPGINLVYDFTSQIIQSKGNEGIHTKKMGSTPNYSYDPRSIPENWGSSNTLPTDKKKKGK